MPTAASYVDPDVIGRIRGLELRARAVVQGVLAGQHRSAQQGFAVEFAEHREYAQGDDLRHLDWKVYGRTERFYLKQYEQETDFAAWLLVDASQSMAYGPGLFTKYDMASLAAASIATLLVTQGDRAGLAVFDASVRSVSRPSAAPAQIQEIVHHLEQGPSAAPTKLGPVLHELAARIRKRGLIILFSDLFDDVPSILSGLQHLRFDGHDVIVFHVLDAAELDFPFDHPTLFRGLESPAELRTDPRGLRAGYLAELRAYQRELSVGCRSLKIDHLVLRTDDDPGRALAHYLAGRARVG